MPPKSAQKPRGASPFAAKPRGVMFGRIYPAGKRPSAKRSSSARLSALPPFSALAAPAPARRWTSSQPSSNSAKTTEQSSPRPRNSSAPPGAASVRCSSSSRLAKKPERQSRDRGAPRTVHPTVGAKPRYQHRGKQMRKGNHLLLPLGSPARGAVAAQRAVTEGLAPTRAGRANLTRQPTPGGRGSPPLRRVGRCARGTNAVGRPAKGASRTPPPMAVARHTLRDAMQRARSLTHINGARDWIRWVVEGGSRIVVNAGVVGQARRLRLTRPGGLAATVHRGRCTLRACAKPALRHTTQRV